MCACSYATLQLCCPEYRPDFSDAEGYNPKALLACSILRSALLLVKDGLPGLSIADDTPICSLAFLAPEIVSETKSLSHNYPSLALGLGYP